MQFRHLLLGVFSFAVTSAALAQENTVKHTFVQIDYGMGGFKVNDADSIDTKGYEIEGSWQALPELLLRGSFAQTDDDESNVDFDDKIDTTKLAVSWLLPDTEDAVGIDVGLRYRKDKSNESLDGIGLGFGVRVMATDALEISGRVDWLEGDYSGSVDAEIGAAWHFTEQLAVNFAYEQLDFKGDDVVNYKDRQWQLGARFTF